MIVVNAKNLTKEYGADVIFENATFHVNEGEKIGIVGPNGAGKTTLFNVLTGEIPQSSGDFFISNDLEVGYLKQKTDFDLDKTVMEEVEEIFVPIKAMEAELEEILEEIPKAKGEAQKKLLYKHDALNEEYKERGGYTYRSEMRGILASMAFPEELYSQKIGSLSGGEKTRLALCLMLLKKPKLLLLDEPTNHLDIGTLRWLEQYLKSYRGTIMVVSHDRFFLDQVCTGIMDLSNGRIRSYTGNYTTYAKKKRLQREDDERRFKAYEKEKAKQEEIVRRFKGRGTEKLAKRAQSREKKLARMEAVEAPEKSQGHIKINFKEKYKSGNDVLLLEGITKGFGIGQKRKVLFENVNMDLKRGDRICIVGANGIGKTTLLKIMLGYLAPDGGRIKQGFNVKPGYYDQEQKLLRDNHTVLEEVQDDFGMYTATELRAILGRFLFRGDDVFLQVASLSGGERARLALLKIMMEGGNLLIMDEPTNHLDIESREIFEEALLDFPGAMVIVSHDRYFLNRIPTKIMELKEDGFETFLGKYDYYVEKKKEISSGKKYLEELGEKAQGNSAYENGEEQSDEDLDGGDGASALSSEEERKLKKQKEAQERKLARVKKALEEEIDTLEKDIAGIEELMCDNKIQEDVSKLISLDKDVKEKRKALEKAFEKWLQYE